MTARRTPPRDRRTRTTADVPRMRDVAHVHRDHDPRAWHWFARGPSVAADGGRRGADEGERRTTDERRNVEEERIRDVSHEPVHGDGANRVWERGEDDRDEDAR